MAWTNPQTWIDGVLIAAANLNAHVRDNLRYLKGLDGVPYIENAIELAEQAAPTTPAAGRGRVFVGNAAPRNGVAACVDDAGVVYQMVRYAEGTFTPTLVGATTAGTLTYDATTGAAWTRLGNTIVVRGQVRVTAIAVQPVGSLYITGLPVAAASVAWEETSGISFSTWHGLTIPAGFTQLGAYVYSGESRIGLIRSGSAQAAARVQGSELTLVGGVAYIRFGGAYQI